MPEHEGDSGDRPNKPPTLDYCAPTRARLRKVHKVLLVVLGVVVATAGVRVLFPQLGRRVTGDGPRTKCLVHLRQIGWGIIMYADKNSGAFPPRLDVLISLEDLNPEVFVCPSSNDQYATGPTTQAMLADFAKPGRCSFVYLGAGRTRTVPAGYVIAHCNPANHSNQGMNVLYGDGNVKWVSVREAKRILAELAAGHNPPWPPTSQPTAGGR